MKKFAKGYLFYRLVCDFFVILFFLFFLAVSFMENVRESAIFDGNFLKNFIIVFLVVYLVKAVFDILYIKLSGYEVGEKEIKCRRGVLYRKLSVLEYSKIHAINKKQNILQRLFNIAVLTIDSGSSNTGYSAEIFIVDKSDAVDNLLEVVKEKQSGVHRETPKPIDKICNNLYEFNSRLKVIYSALTTFLACLVMLFIFAGALILFSVAKYIYNNVNASALGSLKIFVPILLIILAITLIIFVFGLIGAHLRYFKFKLYKNEKGITISYGLLSRNTDTFSLKRIKSVIIKQNLIQRLFGFCSVNLEVVGLTYGKDSEQNSGNNASGVLIPLCKLKDVNQKLQQILPDYLPSAPAIKPKKLAPFLILKTILPITVLVISTVVGGVLLTLQKLGAINLTNGFFGIYFALCFGVALLLTLLIFIVSLLEKQNGGLAVDNGKITVYSGGFTKKCHVILSDNFIALDKFTTPLHKKLGAYSYLIHFYTNTLSNVVTVKYLNGDTESMLYNQLNK